MSIQIKNLYYLLCYAWQHMEESDIVDIGELEPFEHTQDLLGRVLADGTFRLLRRGIDRGYLETHDDLSGIRGKLAISEMAKRALRARGRTACIFEELTHDILHNRILRSTLGALLQLPSLNRVVRSDVRLAHRKLEGISEIRLDRQAFRQVQLDRNRRLYRFLISLCDLISQSLLIDQTTGEYTFVDVRDDYPRMWKLFEDFVIGFYGVEQKHYSVNDNGRSIPWHNARARDESDLARMSQDSLP